MTVTCWVTLWDWKFCCINNVLFLLRVPEPLGVTQLGQTPISPVHSCQLPVSLSKWCWQQGLMQKKTDLCLCSHYKAVVSTTQAVTLPGICTIGKSRCWSPENLDWDCPVLGKDLQTSDTPFACLHRLKFTSGIKCLKWLVIAWMALKDFQTSLQWHLQMFRVRLSKPLFLYSLLTPTLPVDLLHRNCIENMS